MIEIDMKMPSCCDECFALDEHGDYPFCLISQDQRGYTFDTRANRMPSCPMKDNEPRVLTLEELKTIGDKDAVYLETIVINLGEPNIKPAIYQPDNSDDDYICVVSTWCKSGFYSPYNYLKTWRCWSARPTEEQREAVKWYE